MNRNRILKAILVVCLSVVSNPSKAKTITIQEPFISAPASMGKVVLFHDEEGFHISKDDKTYVVEKCWIDSSLQNISSADLEKFLVTGHIFISQMDNGEISLMAKNPIKGGGALGVTVGAFIGKFLVYTVVLVPVAVIVYPVAVVGGALVGAVGGAVGASVVATCAASIETASNAGAIAGGIIGGVLTGPV